MPPGDVASAATLTKPDIVPFNDLAADADVRVTATTQRWETTMSQVTIRGARQW
ncbi:hypothetical protein GCM10017607_29270 [Microbacterium thalassium]|nr:hypothetical protein GCM10017607_29270 [Microbacterium thalassium]